MPGSQWYGDSGVASMSHQLKRSQSYPTLPSLPYVYWAELDMTLAYCWLCLMHCLGIVLTYEGSSPLSRCIVEGQTSAVATALGWTTGNIHELESVISVQQRESPGEAGLCGHDRRDAPSRGGVE
jgi:hypothetical protein